MKAEAQPEDFHQRGYPICYIHPKEGCIGVSERGLFSDPLFPTYGDNPGFDLVEEVEAPYLDIKDWTYEIMRAAMPDCIPGSSHLSITRDGKMVRQAEGGRFTYSNEEVHNRRSIVVGEKYKDLRAAQAEGKCIQFTKDGRDLWVDGPWEFSSLCGEYRLKPEPIVRWLAVAGAGTNVRCTPLQRSRNAAVIDLSRPPEAILRLEFNPDNVKDVKLTVEDVQGVSK